MSLAETIESAGQPIFVVLKRINDALAAAHLRCGYSDFETLLVFTKRDLSLIWPQGRISITVNRGANEGHYIIIEHRPTYYDPDFRATVQYLAGAKALTADEAWVIARKVATLLRLD